jgi:serine protease Do
MGSPFGLSHSVSQGIISGRGRHEVDLERNGVENQDFLQTDAAINPGNSGGPLVNMKGEIVGINIAILSNGGGNEGVGFSIPINLAKWIMGQLLTNGRVNRGALGVKLHPDFEAETAVSLGLDRPKGAWIESVDLQSPAAQGGVRVGDVVLRFNGIEVADLNHLINLVSMAPIGQAADVTIWRDRRELALKVTVADKERIIVQSRPAKAPVLTSSIKGLEMVTLDAPVARKMGLPEELRGAAVMKVEPDSPLASYFRPLDVVYSVGGRPIQSADEVIQALAARRTSSIALELGIHRLVDGAFQLSKVRVP